MKKVVNLCFKVIGKTILADFKVQNCVMIVNAAFSQHMWLREILSKDITFWILKVWISNWMHSMGDWWSSVVSLLAFRSGDRSLNPGMGKILQNVCACYLTMRNKDQVWPRKSIKWLMLKAERLGVKNISSGLN